YDIMRQSDNFFFFSSRRRHTISKRDWSSDVCSSDLQKELGERNGKVGEIGDLREQIEQSDMPERIMEVAKKELERYEMVPQSSAESSVIRNYLEWLLDLPWTEKTKDTLDIGHAKQILDGDHYGLDTVE